MNYVTGEYILSLLLYHMSRLRIRTSVLVVWGINIINRSQDV